MSEPERDERTSEDPKTASPGEAASGFPEPSGPGDPGPDRDREPHHDLNNPVEDPDPTEYPDPYEKRPDPRGPDAREAASRDDELGSPAPPSTSEPHPPRNPDEERHERTSSKGASKPDR